MLINPEAEEYFESRSAHSDISQELLAAVKRLGEYEERYARAIDFPALFLVTNNTVFCGAAGMSETYWRLRPSDVAIALKSSAELSEVGPSWVVFTLYRSDWPKPDLSHWSLRAYDFARTGK